MLFSVKIQIVNNGGKVMAKHKKVHNQEGYEKSKALKGSVRNTVAYDAIHNCKSTKQVDRKRQSKAGGKNKHKGRLYSL